MSLFDDHVKNTDDILLQTYKTGHDEWGEFLIPKQNDFLGGQHSYIDIKYVWKQWTDRWENPKDIHMHDNWFIDLQQYRAIFNYGKFTVEIDKRVKEGDIKVLTLHNVRFYNNWDIFQFLQDYEDMLYWKYCRKHKIWPTGHRNGFCY